jgi:hypothetical protein
LSKFHPLYKAIGGGEKIFSSLKHNLFQQFPYSPSHIVGDGGKIPSTEGMERDLSMEKRREGYRESAGKGFWVFHPLCNYFLLLGRG